MAPCEPRFLLESTGDDSNQMMKTILQKIRVELAILGEKKKIIHDFYLSTLDGLRTAVKAFTLRKNAQIQLSD